MQVLYININIYVIVMTKTTKFLVGEYKNKTFEEVSNTITDEYFEYLEKHIYSFNEEEQGNVKLFLEYDKTRDQEYDLDILITTIKENVNVKHIYHISDIHIRLYQRHEEYKYVFNNLYETLRKEESNGLIVITGDILHSKNNLSPECIQLTRELLKTLSEIMDVVMIAGNHDANLTNTNRLDALTPIIKDIPNIYYLKERGVYHYGNASFGVMSVFDERLIKMNEIETREHTIGLYHGSVFGCETDIGFKMREGYTVTELIGEDQYDYVMLGDIHKYQYLDPEKRIAYSGSLIQQNHGESLDGHGILKWDLETGISRLIEVENDYGYHSLRIIKGKTEELILRGKPRIKFILENTTELQFNNILHKLKRRYNIQEVVKNYENDMTKGNSTIKIDSMNIVNQNKLIKEYITKRSLNVSDEELGEIYSLNTRLNNDIAVQSDVTNNQRWELTRLEFDNMFSYGGNNVINFSRCRGIVGVLGSNYIGKSSILDIILFALFDKCSRGERKDILNINKDKFRCKIEFMMGDRLYCIERVGVKKNGVKKKSSVKVTVKFWYMCDGNKYELTGIDRNDTNRQIREYIGRYEDMIMTSMSMQNGVHNFLDISQSKRKEFLSELLRITVFERLYEKAQKEHSDVKSRIKALYEIYSTKNHNEAEDKLNFLDKNEGIIKKKLNPLKRKIDNLDNDVDQLTKELIPVEHKGRISMKKILSNKTNNERDLLKVNKIIETNKQKLKILQKREGRNKLSSHDVSQIEDNNKLFELEKKEDIDDVNNEINLLNKGIVNIDFNISKYDSEVLQNNKSELESKIKNNNNKTNNYKNILDDEDEILEDHKLFIKTNQEEEKKLRDSIEEHNKLLVPVTKININIYKCKQEYKNLIVKVEQLNKKLGLINIDKYGDIEEEYRNANKHKNELKSSYTKLVNMKNDLRYNEEQVLKLIDHSYDENCEYCMNNDFVREALEAKNNIPKFKKSIMKLDEDYNDRCVANDLIEDRYNEYIQNKNRKFKLEKRKLEYDVRINEIDNKIKLHEEQEKNKEQNNKIKKIIIKLKVDLDKILDEQDHKYDEYINCKNKYDKLEVQNKILQLKLDKIISDIKLYEKNRDDINHNKKLDMKIRELKQELFKIDSDNNPEYELYLKKKDEYEKIVKEIDNIEKNILMGEKDEMSINNKLEKINDTILEHTNTKKIIEENRKKEIKINKMSEDRIEKNKLYEETFKKYYDVVGQLKYLKKKIEDQNEIRDKIVKEERKSITIDMYKKMIKKDSIPYMILSNYIPVIQKEINKVLTTFLNFTLKFELDDNKNIRVYMIKSNNQISAENISGSEKFISNLSIRIGLTTLSILAQPNFIAIDEGWSCFDSSNLSNVAGLLNYLKEKFSYILVISHLDVLKDNVEKALPINRVGNESSIRYI
jgi:DNA repair exonuclease SbcCD ATPase subunit